MIQAGELSGGYGSGLIVRGVSFSVKKGELFGVLGPNGSGKTTLMNMISGLIALESGTILVKGKPIQDYSPKELARVMAVLPQMTSSHFAYSVKETVSLGRYAHQSGFFKSWTADDEKVVLGALQKTGTLAFAYKPLSALSGGERQRVFLAQALAQEPEILLLDEPTNHLDLSFQKDLLDLLKKMTADGLTVISIFHDLNLASLYCDRLLLMKNGSVHTIGAAADIMKEEHIHDVYNTDVQKQPHPEVPKPQMSLLPAASVENSIEITEDMIEWHSDYISIKSPIQLKVLSSGVIGAGWGWRSAFVNRHVDKNYNMDHFEKEASCYFQEKGFDLHETVGMMTAVMMEDAAYKRIVQDDVSVFAVATAGVGNAVDVSRQRKSWKEKHKPGTINIWVFANGKLSEEAFVQGLMTAAEAKAKALADAGVMDLESGTIATGTSTDSILIASTQRGAYQQFAGSVTPLGIAIGRAVYESVTESLEKTRRRKAP
ncbi:adenosylcobinamide amidohydrolase [Domibacillus epiphyticus]|uniref:ABC transporter ATP-binding protein n=1 Tax=Domibacillus epiphyticus TaxID=1714355 RepID=A0A1V2AAQ7_9BACI|nr:adenosylcobinamide amidohydrolase [Domibacillus epiphyticus]OMP68083.1 ABC transporter ATP-binding protein [Domibacillus epiphyticus]